MNSHTRDVILKHFGNQNRMSKALSVSRQVVSIWFSDGFIPPKQAIIIEELLNNDAVKAIDMINK